MDYEVCVIIRDRRAFVTEMISNIYILVETKNNLSYLKDSFYNSPFKIADIREDKKDPALKLMIMSSSPGVLDGDMYHIDIDLNTNSSLYLLTQSYQRIYSMINSATQNFTVRLANNCSFCYLPHPSVPHKNSNFTSNNKIYLSDNCKLIWGEILTCGRKLNREEFLFTKYHTVTQLYLKEKLVLKDNFLIEPALNNYSDIGQMEGYSHQANYIYINHKNDNWRDNEFYKRKSVELQDYLNKIDSISYGLSATPIRGFVIRMLGNKAEQMLDILTGVTTIMEKEEG